MNTSIKIIIALILLYGFISSFFYIQENGFTTATGFFIAPLVKEGLISGVGFHKSSLALDSEKCKDQCYSEDTACFGNKERRCADSNKDGCNEWSEAYPCIGNEVCGISKCGDLTENIQLKGKLTRLGNSIGKAIQFSSCINECNIGDRVAWGEGFYKVCDTNYDQDPCYEWSIPYQCPYGTYARAGICIKEKMQKGSGLGK